MHVCVLPFCTITYERIDQFAKTLSSIMPLEVTPPSQLRRLSFLQIFLKRSVANIINATVCLVGVEDMSGNYIKNILFPGPFLLRVGCSLSLHFLIVLCHCYKLNCFAVCCCIYVGKHAHVRVFPFLCLTSTIQK